MKYHNALYAILISIFATYAPAWGMDTEFITEQVSAIKKNNALSIREKKHRLQDLYTNFATTKPPLPPMSPNRTQQEIQQSNLIFQKWLFDENLIKNTYRELKTIPLKKEIQEAPIPESFLESTLSASSLDDFKDDFSTLNKSILFNPIYITKADDEQKDFNAACLYLEKNLRSLESTHIQKEQLALKESLINSLERMSIFIYDNDLNETQKDAPYKSYRCWLLSLIKQAITILSTFDHKIVNDWLDQIAVIKIRTEKSLEAKQNGEPFDQSEVVVNMTLRQLQQKKEKPHQEISPETQEANEIVRQRLKATIKKKQPQLKTNLFNKAFLEKYQTILETYKKLLPSTETKENNIISDRINEIKEKIKRLTILTPRKKTAEELKAQQLLTQKVYPDTAIDITHFTTLAHAIEKLQFHAKSEKTKQTIKAYADKIEKDTQVLINQITNKQGLFAGATIDFVRKLINETYLPGDTLKPYRDQVIEAVKEKDKIVKKKQTAELVLKKWLSPQKPSYKDFQTSYEPFGWSYIDTFSSDIEMLEFLKPLVPKSEQIVIDTILNQIKLKKIIYATWGTSEKQIRLKKITFTVIKSQIDTPIWIVSEDDKKFIDTIIKIADNLSSLDQNDINFIKSVIAIRNDSFTFTINNITNYQDKSIIKIGPRKQQKLIDACKKLQGKISNFPVPNPPTQEVVIATLQQQSVISDEASQTVIPVVSPNVSSLAHQGQKHDAAPQEPQPNHNNNPQQPVPEQPNQVIVQPAEPEKPVGLWNSITSMVSSAWNWIISWFWTPAK